MWTLPTFYYFTTSIHLFYFTVSLLFNMAFCCSPINQWKGSIPLVKHTLLCFWSVLIIMGRDDITHSIPSSTFSKPVEQIAFQRKSLQITASLCISEDNAKWHRNHTLNTLESSASHWDINLDPWVIHTSMFCVVAARQNWLAGLHLWCCNLQLHGSPLKHPPTIAFLSKIFFSTSN